MGQQFSRLTDVTSVHYRPQIVYINIDSILASPLFISRVVSRATFNILQHTNDLDTRYFSTNSHVHWAGFAVQVSNSVWTVTLLDISI